MLEKGAAPCFGTPESPPGAASSELILARPHPDQSTQLPALKEAVELLHVAAEAVIVSHDNLTPRLLGCSENPFDATRRQRQRTLTQHVDLRLERAQHVRLVQMVGCGDDDCVNLVELEEILDVGKDVRNLHSLGDGARLRTIVITEGDELRAFDLRNSRQMCELCDRPGADEAESNGLAR